ncbi:dihydroorotase [Extibacter muris]|uniref:dihydroorotase n=1 Tax=Extibacter muris TaxID=1796622 RepID=UPI001D075E1A|nr:amidohydrolase family protein [Extibacter muris]MCB6202542.1 amidohydrolase family protein [Extibacter muris]MCQ4664411.1 amidohydrolase family protein [Extibacter muris]MCQ4693620.1 amidohydrolase family protein [Extibacter muris]
MMLDKLYTNAVIVSTVGRVTGCLGVKDGKVAVLAKSPEGLDSVETIDCGGKYMLPGFIDSHIHPYDPGPNHREDFEHLTASMAAGGITTGCMMPFQDPVISDVDTYEYTKNYYSGKGYVDYGIHGGAIATNVDKADELWRNTGATAMKAFMCYSTDDCPFLEDDTLYAHLKILAENGGIGMIHCENDGIIRLREREIMAEGRKDGRAYNASHPDYAEIEAIQRAILFLKQTGAAAVIVHVSTAEGIRLIHKAQEEGVRVWAETCSHYLTFTVDDMDTLGAALKFSPPMHDEQNREELWNLVDKGYVNTISSDHCPFSSEEKFADEDDIWKTPNGIPGVQAIAPVLLNGVNEGRITLEKVVELTSYNASRLYGLYPKKGILQPGSDADFTLVDMDMEKVFCKEDNKSKCPWSPYYGRTFKGWPVMTVCRGEIIYKNGEVVGRQGYGEYVASSRD